MIALDTNLLVYAHRPEMPLHAEARELFSRLPTMKDYMALPWPCVNEFLSVVTNRRIFRDPTPMPRALEVIRIAADGGVFRMLAEGDGYLDCLARMAVGGKVTGAMIHDARIAALCRYHGVTELWSADRDFARFPELKVINPLL